MRSVDDAHSTNSGKILRDRAEDIALEKAAMSPEELKPLSLEETRQTLHELRVHQIELEMQNEELKRTKRLLRQLSQQSKMSLQVRLSLLQRTLLKPA